MFNRDALRKMLHNEEKMISLLERILKTLDVDEHHFPSGFTITQTGDTTMAFAAPDAGNTLVFTATPLPTGSSLGSVVPTWTSSDSANVTITPDSTGLVASVALGSSIAVGESVTLTISAADPTDASGKTVATGSITFTIGSPLPPPTDTFPTSFGIAQSA